MKVMYLVGGDSLSPEQRESYVRKSPLLRRSGRPILPLHHAIIGCRTAKRDSIPFIIGADASKGAASGHSPFKVVNVGRLQIRARRLIVAAILIKPRNWIRIRAAVGGHWRLVPDRTHR